MMKRSTGTANERAVAGALFGFNHMKVKVATFVMRRK